MAELSTHDKLKEIISMAKKTPNFGLALGKSATDEPVLLASKTKAAEVLEKTAKKEAGGNRTGCGTLDFKGGALILNFEADPPPGCLRVMKRHFKFNRITTKLAIVSPCGTVEDEFTYNDDEQGPDDASGEVPSGRERSDADAPPPDPAMLATVEKARKLTGIFDRTRPALADAARAEPAKAAMIDKLVRAFDRATAASPPDVAAMEKIAAAAQQQLAKPARAGGDATALTDLFKKVAGLAMPHAKADPALAQHLRDQTAAFKSALAASPPDLAAAKAAVDALQARIPKPGQAASAPPDRPPPDTPDAPVQRAKGRWTRAFGLAGAEVGKLQEAIKTAAEGTDGIGKVDKAFDELRKTLAQLDAALGKALDPGIGTGDKARIAKARDDAHKLADQVEKILGSHPVLSKIDDNPFIRIRAAATLRQSLSEMREELKAAA